MKKKPTENPTRLRLIGNCKKIDIKVQHACLYLLKCCSETPDCCDSKNFYFILNKKYT